MPRLPRVSGAEAVRALERLGFTQELAIGTLRGILKQAGVRAEEFVAQL
jgi:predicted RNA binding protein YcfA (HicA-like mRNA interferase family)